jgi:hypothetical protein
MRWLQRPFLWILQKSINQLTDEWAREPTLVVMSSSMADTPAKVTAAKTAKFPRIILKGAYRHRAYNLREGHRMLVKAGCRISSQQKPGYSVTLVYSENTLLFRYLPIDILG